MHPVLSGTEQALQLAQLSVGLLQLGRAPREHVEAVVVAHRHLVGEPAEVEGQLSHSLRQLQTARAQLGQGAGWRIPSGHDQPPVSIGLPPAVSASISFW